MISWRIDDLKYESKYKELKKKVREVEEVRCGRFDPAIYIAHGVLESPRDTNQDNEQLYVKILQAQQSIQRLRLERA